MVEFEVSDTPLEKTPFKQEDREFFPTRGEWAAMSRKDQVFQGAINLTSSGATTLFTVPSDSVFFLTGFNMDLNTRGGLTVALLTLRILNPGGSIKTTIGQLQYNENVVGGVGMTLSHDFTMPLLLDSSQVLSINVAGTNPNADAFIFGWIEKKAPTGIQQER